MRNTFLQVTSQGSEKARVFSHQILPLADCCPFLGTIAVCQGRQSGQWVRGRPGDKNPELAGGSQAVYTEVARMLLWGCCLLCGCLMLG